MAFVYLITNTINGKQYVGKTKYTVEHRMKEHIITARRSRYADKPLYSEINLYGAEVFCVEQLEECEDSIGDEREQYWIKKLNTTIPNGYNIAKGGKGKPLYDYQMLANKYIELGTVKRVAKELNCDIATVRKACEYCNVKIKDTTVFIKENMLIKNIEMLDDDKNVIMKFADSNEAGQWVIDNNMASGTLKTVKNNIIISAKSNYSRKGYGHYWRIAVN